MVKTFVNDVFLHIGSGWITGQTNAQTHIPTQRKSRAAFINTQSVLSGHRCMNRRPWFQLQSLHEQAGETEPVKESWKDHIAFTEQLALSLMYTCLSALWPLFFFLSDTPLTFLLLMLFYPFLVFFLFIFFKLAYWLHLILMQSHTESKTSTQSSGFSWFKSTIHFYHNINFTACNLTSVVLCNTFISYAPILRI